MLLPLKTSAMRRNSAVLCEIILCRRKFYVLVDRFVLVIPSLDDWRVYKDIITLQKRKRYWYIALLVSALLRITEVAHYKTWSTRALSTEQWAVSSNQRVYECGTAVWVWVWVWMNVWCGSEARSLGHHEFVNQCAQGLWQLTSSRPWFGSVKSARTIALLCAARRLYPPRPHFLSFAVFLSPVPDFILLICPLNDQI